MSDAYHVPSAYEVAASIPRGPAVRRRWLYGVIMEYL